MQRTYKESQAIEWACTGLHCSVPPWVEAQAWCLLGSGPDKRARPFNAPTPNGQKSMVLKVEMNLVHKHDLGSMSE